MKLQNVKRGVRVEAKQDISRYILKGATGTILQSGVINPYVQWDNFTDGHDGYAPTVPKSSWAVEIQYLRRIKE